MPAKSVTKFVKKFAQDLQNGGFGEPPCGGKTGREGSYEPIWGFRMCPRCPPVGQKSHFGTQGIKNHNLGRKIAQQITQNVPKLAPKSQNGAAT